MPIRILPVVFSPSRTPAPALSIPDLESPRFYSMRRRWRHDRGPQRSTFSASPTNVAYAMLERNEIPPEHIANVLYLEWFSQSNGRIVIETTDYNLTIRRMNGS